ncbi:sigma-70 family RNA polymerase sigma factor [bacterium]|nr:sigma-70 family RNA polymerase sigma factor [bacterium]
MRKLTFLFSFPCYALTVHIFYSPTCGDCQRTLKFLAELEKKEKIKIIKHDLSNPQNIGLLLQYYKSYKIPEEKWGGTLALFVSSHCFTTYEDIKKNLPIVLKERERAPPKLSFKPSLPSLSIFAILSAGLLDGIDPCAFSIIALLFTLLTGLSRRRILYLGFFYILGSFIAYGLLGVGLLQIVKGIYAVSLFSRIFPPLMCLLMFIFFLITLRQPAVCKGEGYVFPILNRMRQSISLVGEEVGAIGCKGACMGEEVFAFIFPFNVHLFSSQDGGELTMRAEEFLKVRYKMEEELAKALAKRLEGKDEKEWDYHCIKWLLKAFGKDEAWEYIWWRCEETVRKAIGFYFKGRKGLKKVDGEDVYCEIRLEIYKSIEKFGGKGNFDSFIWRISERVIKRCLKNLKKWRKTELSGDMSKYTEEEASSGLELEEEIEDLRMAIPCLPPIYRVVVVYYLEGYSYEGMAKLLGCPSSTVRWRFSKALKLLKILCNGNLE